MEIVAELTAVPDEEGDGVENDVPASVRMPLRTLLLSSVAAMIADAQRKCDRPRNPHGPQSFFGCHPFASTIA